MNLQAGLLSFPQQPCFARKERHCMESLERFERTTKIQSPQIGGDSRVKLSDLLKMEQETAEEHMTAAGLPYERLYADGTVLLITDNQLEASRYPVHGEQIRIVTEAIGSAGVHLYRDFLFLCGEEQILRIRQVSVCVDSRTHHPLRPDALYQYHIFHHKNVPPEERVPKLRVAGEQPMLGERPVRFSDLDMNHHLNNTIYGDIVEDFLPEKYRRGHKIRISYIAENHLGDMLKIYGGYREKDFVLYGENQTGLSFAATAEL
jgi:acyl-ACP thioesterase